MLVGQKIGPFTIDKELGAGAMGAVYRARHAETGQRVAIKIVAPGLGTSDKAAARFKREAAILKQFNHPNIVRLVATGKFSGTPFYAMEYIEGESLDRVMARRGRLSWEEVVEIGRQLCDALKHAHEKGVVHRDLKPSNVMVLPDGTVKLTDFGIAKDLDVTALTSANCTVGTASYMSPEQCKGERDLTHKSDLYSMGVMFYELLTARKPFEADNPMDMFMKHVQGTFERPSRVVLDIPVWLDTLICQLLEKKPDQRPYDAAMVADALGRVREKVEAQQSAGEAAVKTRIGGRTQLDDEDREAARALRGKKKKKKKDARAPFYQQGWFKAVAYSAALVAIGAVFYLVFFKTPSADSLFAAAEAAWNADPQDRSAARPAVAEYLQYYGDRTNERTRTVQGWADHIDRKRAEHFLLGEKNELRTPDPEDRLGWKAIEREEEGNLDEARKLWTDLTQYKALTDPNKRGYGLIAEDRLRELKKVDELEDEVVEKLKLPAGLDGFKDAPRPERLAATALFYERVKEDRKKALPEWMALKRETAKKLKEGPNPIERRWYLLAARHVRALGGAARPPAEGGAFLYQDQDRWGAQGAFKAHGPQPVGKLRLVPQLRLETPVRETAFGNEGMPSSGLFL